MMQLLDDTQRQRLIQALMKKDRATALLERTGYVFPEADLALIALLSGVDTKVWVDHRAGRMLKA